MAKPTQSRKANNATTNPPIFPEIAIQIAETMPAKHIGYMTEALLVIANAQAENGDVENAMVTARKAMDCIAKDKSKLADEVSLRNDNIKKLCDFLLKHGKKTDVQTALDFHESAIGNIKDSYVKMSEYLRRAEFADKIGDKKRADSLLKKATESVNQVKKPKTQIGLYRYIIRTCSKLGRKKQAKALLVRALSLGKDMAIEALIPGFSRKQIITTINQTGQTKKELYWSFKTVALEFAKSKQIDEARIFYEKALVAICSTDENEDNIYELANLARSILECGRSGAA